MQIQPISAYCYNANHKIKTVKKTEEPIETPVEQPSFKGIKGFIKGGVVGAGLTVAGVVLTAGAAALPLFAAYIAANGAIAGTTGHLIEKQNKDNND